MKNTIIVLIFSVVFSALAWMLPANAQMPALYGTEDSRSGTGDFSNNQIDWNEVVEHTAREEQEGKELWDKLQSKEIFCEDLSSGEFGVLGEYFMGQMAGDSHAAMNTMMIQTHGEEGEERIHIVIGKRLSGCDASATFPAGSGGWMPMMNMLVPYQNGTFGSGMPGFSSFGWIFMILWWVLIIVGLVALLKWLTNQSRGINNRAKSALEILQEKYVKGEINKQEFEEKNRDLS